MGEGFSLAIIEYMSAGLPVLVPDIESVSQAIAHDKTGFVYHRDEPESAALYLAELAKNENRRLTMGSEAKHVADSRYNLNQCTDSLIDAVGSIL